MYSTSFFRQSVKMASKSHPIAPARVLVSACFNDMSILGEAIEWDLDFRQIEAGELNARAVLLAGHQNMAMRVEFDRKFHQRGCAPPGILTFGFPDRKSGPLHCEPGSPCRGFLFRYVKSLSLGDKRARAYPPII